MEIDKLHFDKFYESGISASIDWIAGGNFDGYIYQMLLKFSKEDRLVTLFFKVLDKSRYDDEINDSQIQGEFSIDQQHAAIICVFENFEMRGSILGNNNEYIAFSVLYSESRYNTEVCYKLKKE
ncbi:MAG: hypothetical protein MUC49_20450 [Raineya sp.]|jgi:hypothetical protein|nr:hypothetical protein [Raineya sp.]